MFRTLRVTGSTSLTIWQKNKEVVSIVKSKQNSTCDICGLRIFERYGVECIEAHHKKPMSTYSSSYVVTPSDFVLLCPNCHQTVHRYMKVQSDDDFHIRELVIRRLQGVRDTDVLSESSNGASLPTH